MVSRDFLFSAFFFFLFFFFSSRRRHTRWPRDWSSDVCSSDLPADRGDGEDRRGGHDLRGVRVGEPAHVVLRSEERRVGKECRSRWSPEKKKKKRTIVEIKKCRTDRV